MFKSFAMKFTKKILTILILSCCTLLVFYIHMQKYSRSFPRFTLTYSPRPSSTGATPDARSSHVICTEYKGRLGNQMFSMATSFSFALQRKMGLVLPTGSKLRQLFTFLNDTVSITDDENNCTGAKDVDKGKDACCKFNPDLLVKITGKENVWIRGYVQVYKYFDAVSSDVRRLFTVNNYYKNSSREMIFKTLIKRYQSYSKWSGRTFVGVHIRRGDMTLSEKQTFGHGLAPLDYILRAMAYFDEHFTNVTFVVCTDDPKWVEENIQHEHALLMKGNSDLQDFAILLQMNHTAVTTGSFGWWAAWLVNGTTVYYKHYYVPNSTLSTEFNDVDYIISSWIAL